MPRKAARPYTIGLIGGIAAGKSHAAKILVQMGAKIIDADKLGHSVLNRPLILRRLSHLLGSGIQLPDGTVDRAAISRLVFGNDQASTARRKILEDTLHPVIHAEAVKQLRSLRSAEPPSLAVVLDAPLLLEANWTPMCDIILFVDCPVELRRERALARNWDETDFQNREAAQMAVDSKRQHATHVVDGADESNMRKQLQVIWEELNG